MNSGEFQDIIKSSRKILNNTIIASFIVIGGLVAFLIYTMKKQETKVYVIADNGRFTANLTESDVIYDFDLRNHVKLFLYNMYSFDQYNYNEHVETGLNLIDTYNGKRIFNDMDKGGIYELMKKQDVRVKVVIDSIVVNNKIRPFSGRAYFRQRLMYSDQMKDIPLALKFDLVPVSRSDKNPFGFIIANLDYIDYVIRNEDLSIKFNEVSTEAMDTIVRKGE